MTTPLPDPIDFVQGGPFFDMAGAFVVATSGLLSILHPSNPMGFKRGIVTTLEGKAHPELKFDLYEVHRNAVEKKVSSPQVVRSLLCMLMNTAYDAVEDRNDKSPEFEFFRHIRNASSHGNSFNFRDWEPSRPASWRGLVIDHTRKGNTNPLFGTLCFGGLMGTGDPLVLLWDIEQKLKQP